jgi:signal peptidase I
MRLSKSISSIIAIVIVTALTGCTKKEMRQSSSSMEPTIRRGEVISVDLAAYSGSGPNRWDVIVFESPVSGGGQWLGRVVGLPGESVEIRSGGIVIDGREEARPAHLSLAGYELPKKELALSSPGPVTFPYKIPVDSYFILGDNVSNALDSRYWGGLDRSKILGKVPGK